LFYCLFCSRSPRCGSAFRFKLADRSPTPPACPGQRRVEPQNDDKTRFVRNVLADPEDNWGRVFEAAGRRYVPPALVLYSGGTGSRVWDGSLPPRGRFIVRSIRKLL
jgi:hypothetical protein